MLLCQNHELIPAKWHNTYWPPLFVFIFKPQHSTLHTDTPTTDHLISEAPFNNTWPMTPRGLTIRSFLFSDSKMRRPLFTFGGRTQPEHYNTTFHSTNCLTGLSTAKIPYFIFTSCCHDWTRLAIFRWSIWHYSPPTATHSLFLYPTKFYLANHWNQPLYNYRDVHRSSNSMPCLLK